MEKASVGADTAVCRDTVQIAVCQKALFQRLESNDTLSVFGGGLLQSVFFNGPVQDIVGVLIDDERTVQILL